MLEVDELVLVLEVLDVLVGDDEEVFLLDIEVLDGELVVLVGVFVDEDELDVDADGVDKVLFAVEVFVLVQLEELLVEVLVALDEVLVDIVDDELLELVVDEVQAVEVRQCQDNRFELRSTLELLHCASLLLQQDIGQHQDEH